MLPQSEPIRDVIHGVIAESAFNADLDLSRTAIKANNRFKELNMDQTPFVSHLNDKIVVYYHTDQWVFDYETLKEMAGHYEIACSI